MENDEISSRRRNRLFIRQSECGLIVDLRTTTLLVSAVAALATAGTVTGITSAAAVYKCLVSVHIWSLNQYSHPPALPW